MKLERPQSILRQESLGRKTLHLRSSWNLGCTRSRGLSSACQMFQRVVSSSKAVGNTAVNSLKGAISNLAASVSGDLTLALQFVLY